MGFILWGFDQKLVHEADWFTALDFGDGFTVRVLPSRHFSGRLLTRNKTLWTGLALVTTERRIFYGGDGGYGPHFKQIGRYSTGLTRQLWKTASTTKTGRIST